MRLGERPFQHLKINNIIDFALKSLLLIHEANVLQTDLRDSNLLYFDDDDIKEVQIIDFDLALFEGKNECELVVGSVRAKYCGQRIRELIENGDMHSHIKVQWGRSDDYEMLFQFYWKRIQQEYSNDP